MIRVVLLGAAGRMGRAVTEAAAGLPDLSIKAQVDLNLQGGSGVWRESLDGLAEAGDVVIEFSSPAACREAARRCAEARAGLVSGTTGLSAGDEAELQSAARSIAILRASNFSLGVLALRRAVDAALAAAPGTWDVEIVERHHRGKQDSPSGTALTLARDAASARGYPASSLRHGREGRVGSRPAAEIGIHAVRGGSWVGDHQVLLAGPGEWLELRHVVQDRVAFAHGALTAAEFVANASPGFYTLDSVLSAAAGGKEVVPRSP